MSISIQSTRIVFDNQASAPSAPPASKVALYAKTDDLLYARSSSGTEYPVSFNVGSNLVLSGGTLNVGSNVALLNATQTFTAAQTFGNLTISTATLTISGAGSNVKLDAAAGNNRDIIYLSGGINRWIFRCNNDSESGSDAGSNWVLMSRTDAGGIKSNVLFAERATGNIGIGTTTPTALLDINSTTLRLRSSRTPASSSASGNAGDICWDNTNVYICIATNTWRRIAHATW